MLNLIRFCVQRKVTVAMMTAAVFIFGMISWARLPREFMPELQFPQLVILTNFPNASSQEIENLVTKVVEESAGTVKNVRRIHSSSRESISIVTVEFYWGTNMDMASLNLREKVDLVKAKLPRDCGEPRIEKFNPFALPVISLSLSGSINEKDLAALARRPVSELLEKCKGVAAVSITGGREREILVELEQSKLTARGLPILDVVQAISRANVTYPAGTVKDQTFEYVVRVMGSFKTVDELGDITVAMDRSKISSALSETEIRRRKQERNSVRDSSQHIPLSSLGTIKDGLAELTSYSRYDGNSNISLSILKQAEANVVRVADEVKLKISEIQSKLPRGVTLQIVYDQSQFVKSGIRSLIQDAIFGAALAFLALGIFLGNWKDAAIVFTAIPISIFTTFIIMDAKGMSLNTITLAGLSIGIGMLVDAAIVVQENIARHRDMGKSVYEAAVEGGTEMFGAVMGTVLTTVVVFIPLIFVSGVVGQVFRDLSWTVVFSQMASLVVAMTLIPLLAAHFSPSPGSAKKEIEIEWIKKMQLKVKQGSDYYEKILNYALDHPVKVVKISGVMLLISLMVLVLIPRSLFPKIEADQILMRLDMPMGTSVQSTNEAVLKIEELIQKIPDVAHRSSTVGSIPQEGLQPLGSHQGQMVIDLKENRKNSTEKIIRYLKAKIKEISIGGGRVYFYEQGGSFALLGQRGESAPVVIEIKGHDLDKMGKISEELLEQLKKVKGLFNLRTNISEPSPELQLNVNREALANLTLSVSDLAEAVLTAIHGKTVSKFREEGKEINIKVQLREEDRKDLGSVQKLYVHSPLDVDVPIGSLAMIQEGKGPSEIIRYDQQRTVMVMADIQNRSIDSVSKEINALISKFRNEKEISLTLTGESTQLAESLTSLKIVLFLSIVFVFMIMAAEFESLWLPVLILLTVPLSLIGMVIGLLIFGHHLTVMAGMGLVLLGGIVVDNGIVMIDFVIESRKSGADLKKALQEGCKIRLRPILMTATSSILGMLPLALGLGGKGAEMQAPMAAVIVFGLLVSTLLTLVFIPALFLLIDERVFKKEKHRKILRNFEQKFLELKSRLIRTNP